MQWKSLQHALTRVKDGNWRKYFYDITYVQQMVLRSDQHAIIYCLAFYIVHETPWHRYNWVQWTPIASTNIYAAQHS